MGGWRKDPFEWRSTDEIHGCGRIYPFSERMDAGGCREACF